jgi:5-formyltetrahydrofolate cyclo-ligase
VLPVRYHRAMPHDSDARNSNGGHTAGPALREIKRALRARVLAARDALEPADRSAAAQAIVQRITALPAYRTARALLVTLPFGSEWDTRPLVGIALAATKTIVLPRVNTRTRMLELHAIADPTMDVVPGHLGIPEPRVSCPLVAHAEIDVVIVPGVAFDAAGRRLGYGGGYYDRLLPLLSPDVPRIAGAFELQVIAEVPAAPHDLRVDCIATETRLIRAVP